MRNASQWVNLCNRALGRLGAQQIASLTEASPSAAYCNTYLPEAINAVLAQYDWHSSRKRIRIAPLVERPNYGFAYQYPKPGNCIRLVSVSSDGEPIEYAVEAGVILANEKTIDLVYIEVPAEPGKLHPSLEKAICLQLAAYLCTPMISNEALMQSAFNEAQIAIDRAKTDDAAEVNVPADTGERWYTEARR